MNTVDVEVSEHLTIAGLLEEQLLRHAWPIVDGDRTVPLEWARSAQEALANASDLTRTVVVGDDGVLTPDVLPVLEERGAALVLVREPNEGRWAHVTASLPVLGFSSGASIDGVIRLVAQLALAHESHVLRYATSVHEKLATLLHRGVGIESICQQIERLTGCAVAFLDATNTLQAIARDQHPWIDSSTAGSIARRVSTQEGTVPGALGGHHPVHEHVVEVEGHSAQVLCLPVTVAERSEGWLVLIAASDDQTGHDTATRVIALQEAVSIVGTEVLRMRSIERAEERARGNFVHALLHGRFSNTADLVARAAHRRFPTDRRFGVVIVQVHGLIAENDSPQHLSNMARTALRLRGADDRAALSAVVGDVIAVVREVAPATRSGTDKGSAEVAAYATALHRRLQSETHRQLLVTYGRPVDGAMRISESYREARIALSLAGQLGKTEPVGFLDMRTHVVLLDLALSQEGRAYASEMLTPLRQATGDLEDAARTYIEDGGNLTRASRDLNVHRNTMLYKLDRASKTISQDLRDPETQFSLWLAMKLDLLAETADNASRAVDSG
ncbi:PucR family transcriptional regulator [Janibacter sp. GS2]|uniref:PucR family transcriptional regulator n=1 Tax=Janibacter sp. GS2 TaxID=3442646 RepID=UPI003EBD21F2